MQRIHVISLALGCGLLAWWPVEAAMPEHTSPFPTRYRDHYEISASDGMLIGGEGRTGDSMRYQGKRIWRGPGAASVLVDQRSNAGIVMGSIRTKGHTYTVLMDHFSGEKPFQGNGIARFVELHGLTKHGEPILPRVFAYLAGWGRPCTVWKDAQVLYHGFSCHFMLTEKVRDPESGEIEDFPGKEDIAELLKAERGQGDYTHRRSTRRQIAESADSDHAGLQLHVIAHTNKEDLSSVPPYETAMHFMWNDVHWWSGPQRSTANVQAGSSDKQIERMIKQELKNSPIMDAQDIDVRVKKGDVTLAGTADSAVEKNHAYFSAWVPGVKAIHNQIAVQGDERVSDRELHEALLQAYALDSRILHWRPTVTVRDGVVTLRGIVGSSASRHAAEELARQFGGVREVHNHLKILERMMKGEPTGRDTFIQPGVSSDDWDLKQHIDNELTLSPFVDADHVQVTVRHGVAYLFGSVEDPDEMESAIETAYEAGAERVDNHMTIEQS